MAISRYLTIFLILAFCPPSAHSQAEPNPIAALDWQFGPGEGRIADKATINIPEGYVFLGSKDTRKLMEIFENIPSDNEFVFAPDDLRWWSVFSFNPVGYVEDDETLDADDLLDSVARGTEQGNIERKKRGWNTMSIEGWRFQPRYDKESKLLEWAFIAKENETGNSFINYNTRLLGRKGVMEVVLVSGQEILDTSVVDLKKALGGYNFVPGEKYAEYRQGDRVAQFGLAALITGGVAAVATKKGVWATLAAFFAAAWKFIAAGVVAFFAWLGSLFKSRNQ